MENIPSPEKVHYTEAEFVFGSESAILQVDNSPLHFETEECGEPQPS